MTLCELCPNRLVKTGVECLLLDTAAAAPGRFKPVPNTSGGQAVKRCIWLRDPVTRGVAVPLFIPTLWRDMARPHGSKTAGQVCPGARTEAYRIHAT